MALPLFVGLERDKITFKRFSGFLFLKGFYQYFYASLNLLNNEKNSGFYFRW
ncbi:hypothetical protein CLV48_11635 [Cecembia rubra]|uniref:Uncharacterized protein n=1 Tax=Cecembia rubra TaxID=1485585 RepID=A0A2P8DRK4_9BACT|nr:hypothetical protein CLV48_11635 [Cecembia rubra]